MDSPSRQLLTEQLERLRIVDQEFLSQLDREEQLARELHNKALEAAKADHERVRKRAELESQHWILEQEQQKKKELEEAEARIRARKQRDAAEELIRRRQREETERLEREEIERLQREDAERKARIEAERKAKEAAAQRAKEEADRKEREAAEFQAKEDAARDAERKAQKAASVAPTTQPEQQKLPTSSSAIPAPSNVTSTSTLPTPASSTEVTHQQYLALHKRLKEFRKEIKQLGAAEKSFKNLAFEGRTEIRKRVAQISGVKLGYKTSVKEISKTLKEALANTQHGYDVRKVLVPSSPIAQQSNPVLMSTLFIYMLHMFGKCIIQQLIRESAATSPKVADNIGIAAVSIFSDPELKCGDIALVDMLLAKIHKLVPTLFGVYGSEKTPAGRERLGWREFDDKQAWQNITTSVTAGFAALHLRNLTKLRVKRDNPFLNSEYWAAIARIVNTPVAEITETHLIVLKCLINNNAEKFIQLYGQMAKVALRHALTSFPAAVFNKYPNAAGALQVLPEVMKKELHLTL